MKIFLFFIFLFLVCSCNDTDKNTATDKTDIWTVSIDSATVTEMKEPNSSVINIFGLKMYLDSINQFDDKVPSFLTDPCFDSGFNLSGKVMAHGSAINPSARYEIVQKVIDTVVLIKLKNALMEIPTSNIKPYYYLSDCKNRFDSIEHSTLSIVEIIEKRISNLKQKKGIAPFLGEISENETMKKNKVSIVCNDRLQRGYLEMYCFY